MANILHYIATLTTPKSQSPVNPQPRKLQGLKKMEVEARHVCRTQVHALQWFYNLSWKPKVGGIMVPSLQVLVWYQLLNIEVVVCPGTLYLLKFCISALSWCLLKFRVQKLSYQHGLGIGSNKKKVFFVGLGFRVDIYVI
jgi:hypothetical protein